MNENKKSNKIKIIIGIIILAIIAIAIFIALNLGKSNKHEHSYGNWEVVKEATCTEKGVKERFCECGKRQENNIAIVDHTPVSIPMVEPTCVETGLTEGSKCAVCSKILIKQEDILTISHIYSEATCLKAKTCSMCQQIDGDPLPHNISNRDGKCVNCGTFEYNDIATTRYATQSMISWINYRYDFDSYEILNVYYILHDRCVCDYCTENEYVGEPYLTAVLFYEYTWDGETDVYLEMVAIHKTYNSNSPYYIGSFSQDWNITYRDDSLIKLYASDYSYYYEEDDLILVSKTDVLG